MKKALMIMLLAVMFLSGGLVFAECSADTAGEPEITTEEPEEITEETPEEPEQVEPEAMEEEEPEEYVEEEKTPAQIIEDQTGLPVDYIKVIDTYNDWGAYYCHCDGDLYCITIKGDIVDVCQILN